jgi:hypothetical protein
MSTTTLIAVAIAIVFGILYVMRRRGRLRREDQD